MSAKEFNEQIKIGNKFFEDRQKENMKKPKPNKYSTKPFLTKNEWQIVKVMLSVIFFMTAVILISKWFDNNRLVWQSPIILRSPVLIEKREGVAKELSTTRETQVVPEPTLTATPSPTPSVVKQGKVSYYSHSGCLGCGDNQTTASGEKFDENAMTLAIPAEWRKEIPMGTKVRVTNLDNGIAVLAKVNDTGGFGKYNRIADLSLGLYQAIEAKTDVSEIKIEVL